jgi:hypothetical protein
MNRRAIFVMFAFLGFAIAFAAAMPAARSGTPAPVAAPATTFEVPLAWIAEALAQMPFILPVSR